MESIILSTNQSAGANTGKFPSFLTPGLMKGDYLVPFNWKVDFEATDSLEDRAQRVVDAIATGLIANEPADRIYFIGAYESLTDNSTAATTQTLGYGKKVDAGRGVYDWDHTFDDGGLDYCLRVQKFNGKIRQFKTVRLDEKGIFYGTNVRSGTGYNPEDVIGFKGLQMSRFHCADWKMANKDTEPVYMVSISLKNAAEWNEDLAAIETGRDMISYLEPYAIQDVLLRLVTTTAPGQITFAATLGGINIVEHVPSIVDTLTNFLVTNTETGGTIDVTAAQITEKKFITLTVDTMDPDYDAGVPSTISLASISTLALSELKYYESNVIKFNMP